MAKNKDENQAADETIKTETNEKIKKSQKEQNPKDKEKSKDKEKKEGGFSLSDWFIGVKSEFKRVTWPSRNEVIKMTVSVIATSALIGVIIIGYDFVLAAAYSAALNFFGV